METAKRPLIGLVPLMDYQKASYWILPGYMEGIQQAGGVPVMLPLTGDETALRQLADTCDGFLLTGGQDVGPALYGGADPGRCGEQSPERDAMEQKLLALARAQDKPVLGICRGIQFLNAALGGTLWQDLAQEYPSEVNHHQTGAYDAPIHTVQLLSGTPLADLLGKDTLPVNSYHHQAIRELAPGLVPWPQRPTVLSRRCTSRASGLCGPCSGTRSFLIRSTRTAARFSRPLWGPVDRSFTET